MRGLAGIILNTFRESVRQPFYVLLLAGGAAALVIMVWVPLFTFHSDIDMYKDLGLSFVLLFVMLAGLLSAATGVAREVEDKTAHTILSKAVGRPLFIIGKYVGAMGSVALATVVLGTVFAVAAYYRVELETTHGEHSHAVGGMGREIAAFRAVQLNQAFTVTPGLVMVVLQVGVLAALATALSTRLSVTASVALSLAAYVAGHLTVFLEGAVRATGGVVSVLAQAVMAVVPFLEILNINQKLSHTVLAPFAAGGPGAGDWAAVWAYVGWSAAYALAYAMGAVGLAIMLFRRRPLA
jgi:ABC-type transport system involved in multi-copper enzyme maturation permease subunit